MIISDFYNPLLCQMIRLIFVQNMMITEDSGLSYCSAISGVFLLHTATIVITNAEISHAEVL